MGQTDAETTIGKYWALRRAEGGGMVSDLAVSFLLRWCGFGGGGLIFRLRSDEAETEADHLPHLPFEVNGNDRIEKDCEC